MKLHMLLLLFAVVEHFRKMHVLSICVHGFFPEQLIAQHLRTGLQSQPRRHSLVRAHDARQRRGRPGVMVLGYQSLFGLRGGSKATTPLSHVRLSWPLFCCCPNAQLPCCLLVYQHAK